jgi:predicted AAA+ superfamily ATPase
MYTPVQLPAKATAVVGVRRSGKTTYLHQLRRERAEQGVPRERLPYLNFEDERLVDLTADQLGLLVEDYYRQYPALRGREVVTWCFDEIHYVVGWERLVRRLLDSERVEVFVTGSSAALLSREVATALRGRAWEVAVYPFGFAEVLDHRGQPVPEVPGRLSSPTRSAIERAFLAYLGVGGFPEAQGLDAAARSQLLPDCVDVAILRDVVERHGVTHIVGLLWLVRHLLANAASTFSVERFHAAMKSQGLVIAKDTVHRLLEYVQDCFLVRTVWMESNSERQRMVNPRKAYPVDPGLIGLFERSGRANRGRALETVVMLELERRGYEVHYVRTAEGWEVDFLAHRPGDRSLLVQVCAEGGADETLARELRGLEAASRHYTRASGVLVTLDAAAPTQLPPGMMWRPAAQWLLEADPAGV